MTEAFGNVLSWAVDLEDEAREQAIRSAALPFVEKPLALMPDAHWGMGATVGSVIATRGAIVPAFAWVAGAVLVSSLDYALALRSGVPGC